MRKIWILALFVFCSSAWAQEGTVNPNSQPALDLKSAYGPLPNPEIRFDLTPFPNYRTNEQVMRAAVIAYYTQYIGIYKKEYIRTRGLLERTKVFEKTEAREISAVQKMPAAELFKSTFSSRPEQLKRTLDAAAVDLDFSIPFQTLKEMQLIYTELSNIKTKVDQDASTTTKTTNQDEFATKEQLNQLKAKVEENEKLKLIVYALGFLTICSLGLGIFNYRNY